MRGCYSDFKSYIEYSFLFDAAYSNSKEMSSDWNSIAAHTQTSTNSKVSALWFNAYDIIYRLNTVLEDALQMSNESDQQLVSAQAKCVRAYLYYTLAFWFGNIPIEEGSSSDNSSQVSLDEVYSYILNDVNSAFQYLPVLVGPSEEITLNKFFAAGIKARTMLLQDGMDKEQGASDATSQIINSGMYALSIEVDTVSYESTENIFGFEEMGNVGFLQNYNWQFVAGMRYTEVVLMYAEASYKLGQIQKALQFMNMLLERRDMAPLSEVSLNDIYQQWKAELKYEGCTFSYYKRFSKIQEELGIDESKFLLPIPMAVFMSNPNIFQNAGY